MLKAAAIYARVPGKTSWTLDAEWAAHPCSSPSGEPGSPASTRAVSRSRNLEKFCRDNRIEAISAVQRSALHIRSLGRFDFVFGSNGAP